MARVATPPKPPRVARRIFARLFRQHPDADTELRYRNPFELLVATILSAQTTDAGVNRVTPALFDRYPDAGALARADRAELEALIKPTGFYRQKARTLLAVAQALVDRHGGRVPDTMEAMVALPGVGRKTASVVLGHAFKVPALAVDRHVLRVANRIGLANSDDPEIVEQQLAAVLPPADWTRASDTLILHGRRICRPKPLCDRCSVREDCEYYRRLEARPAARRARAPVEARRAGAARRR
ncbi:MAG TPA: endonuclease III [Vicinamibacterales bacterium]|nr:endonuclease III [Vicinamibacterales bacterium]